MILMLNQHQNRRKVPDFTFGIYRRQDGQLSMGNKVVQIDGNGKVLLVDGKKYKFTPGLTAFIGLKPSTTYSVEFQCL